MKNQLIAIPRLFYRPKAALTSLPNDKICVFAILVPLYFGYARALRTGGVSKIAELTGSKFITLGIIVVLGLIGIFLGGVVVKLIVMLFGKRLKLFKLINLHGYSMIPRFMISAPTSLYVNYLMSEDQKIELMLGMFPLWFKVGAIAGGILLFYGIALYIFGIVVSPGIEDSTPPDVIKRVNTGGPPPIPTNKAFCSNQARLQ